MSTPPPPYYFCFFRRHISFLLILRKVLELSSLNLLCRIIGTLSCLGLLSAVVALYLLVSVHLRENDPRYFTKIGNTRLLCLYSSLGIAFGTDSSVSKQVIAI